jgi:hypothetical protein
MAVEISGTDQRLLTTHGTPASIKPAVRPMKNEAYSSKIVELG